MSDIGISINLITTDAEFKRMVMESMRDELNKVLPTVAKEVADRVSNNIKRVFVNTNEYDALVNGPLDAHFGIPKGEAIPRLDSIINMLADSIVVEVRRISIVGQDFRGGLTIKAVNAEFTDVLGLSAAKITLANGGSIPWLEWLLLKGDSIIIANYDIDFGSHPESRSGEAIMVKDDTKAWKVPIGVSGTIRDNWIIRAIENSVDFLEKLVDGAVQDAFNKVF